MPTHRTCDCHGDASQHASHTIRTMARSASTVVSGRVTNDTAKALASYCSTHDCTQSEALRKALVVLSASGDPAKALASIAAILGLEANASIDDIQAALTELSGPDGSDPLGQNVDVAPAKLSASDRALAAKISDPSKRAAFVALRQKFTTPIKRLIQAKPKAKK